MRYFLSLFFTLAFVCAPFAQSLSADEPIDIGSRLEIFVDQFLIGSLDGTTMVLHEPRDEGAVLALDKSWEGSVSAYFTIFKDGDIYRMYYRGGPDFNGRTFTENQRACYCESPDGIHWTRPNLGIREFEGNKDNNILFPEDSTFGHNFAPFLDQNPNAKPEEKYKALAGLESLTAFSSPDGIHWKKMQEEPVLRHNTFKCDSQNVSFWSETEGKYVCYLRTFRGPYRTITRVESDDFINWTPEPGIPMLYGDSPLEQFYINQTQPYFRAPHIYLATAARFMEGKRVVTHEEALALKVVPVWEEDCSDSVLMTTRGGNQYDRTFKGALIRPTLDLGDWTSRTNYPACGIVPTGDDEMSMYALKNSGQPLLTIHRYSWKLDRIASVAAPYEGGEMTTKPFVFSGEDLYINANTSVAGDIRVEILDENGTPIPGYTLEDAIPLTGNWLEKKVPWEGEKNLASLAGKTVKLHFVMKDADIYALRFK